MQLVEIFEILGEEYYVGAAMAVLIRTANKSISRVRNLSYPMTLTRGGVRNQKINICVRCVSENLLRIVGKSQSATFII